MVIDLTRGFTLKRKAEYCSCRPTWYGLNGHGRKKELNGAAPQGSEIHLCNYFKGTSIPLLMTPYMVFILFHFPFLHILAWRRPHSLSLPHLPWPIQGTARGQYQHAPPTRDSKVIDDLTVQLPYDDKARLLHDHFTLNHTMDFGNLLGLMEGWKYDIEVSKYCQRESLSIPSGCYSLCDSPFSCFMLHCRIRTLYVCPFNTSAGITQSNLYSNHPWRGGWTHLGTSAGTEQR